MAELRNETDIYKYIKLEALPNLPVLGPKFKAEKTFGNLKNGITSLSSEEIMKLQEIGKVEIIGKTLDKGDVLIKEKFKKD